MGFSPRRTVETTQDDAGALANDGLSYDDANDQLNVATGANVSIDGSQQVQADIGLATIEKKTISAATANVDFTTGIDGTHAAYIVFISDLTVDTGGVTLNVRVSNDGGGTYQSGASDYAYANHVYTEGSATGTDGNGGTTEIQVINSDNPLGNGASDAYSGYVRFSRPADGSVFQFVESKGVCTQSISGTPFTAVSAGGAYLTAEAINGFRFTPSSGNIDGGVLELMGVN